MMSASASAILEKFQRRIHRGQIEQQPARRVLVGADAETFHHLLELEPG
jgi:hypothetical protein